MRALQNEVISRLPKEDPDREPGSSALVRANLGKRDPVTVPFNPRHDVWMRYRDERDLCGWTGFISRLLPVLVERFEAAIPAKPELK